MTNRFLFSLAAQNLKKNKREVFPYLLTCICTVMFYFSLATLAYNPGVNTLPGADEVQQMFLLGLVVLAVFSFLLLFYTNGFLLKRRHRELGIYSVLGLEKNTSAGLWALRVC